MKTKMGFLKMDQKEALLYQFDPNVCNNNGATHNTGNWIITKNIKAYIRGHNSANELHYFKNLIKELEPFGVLIMAAHGKGHANEGEKFEAYIQKHQKNMRNLIVGHVATQNHRTENQLLAEAEIILERLELKSKI